MWLLAFNFPRPQQPLPVEARCFTLHRRPARKKGEVSTFCSGKKGINFEPLQNWRTFRCLYFFFQLSILGFHSYIIRKAWIFLGGFLKFDPAKWEGTFRPFLQTHRVKWNLTLSRGIRNGLPAVSEGISCYSTDGGSSCPRWLDPLLSAQKHQNMVLIHVGGPQLWAFTSAGGIFRDWKCLVQLVRMLLADSGIFFCQVVIKIHYLFKFLEINPKW